MMETDKLFGLAPHLVPRILRNLTFSERYTTVAKRSNIRKEFILMGLEEITIMKEDINSISSSLALNKDEFSPSEYRNAITDSILKLLPTKNAVNSLSIYVNSPGGLHLRDFMSKAEHILSSLKKVQILMRQTTHQDMEDMFTFFPHLSSISFQNSGPTKLRDPIQSFRMLSSDLTDLCLDGVLLGQKCLGSLFRKCPNLKVLKLRSIIKPIELIIPEHVQLEELAISCVDADILNVRGQTSIKSLSFLGPLNCMMEDILQQVYESRCSLECLHFGNFNIPQNVEMLDKFSNLKQLFVANLHLISDIGEFLKQITVCKTLQRLELFDCSLNISNYQRIYNLVNSLSCLTMFKLTLRSPNSSLDKAKFQSKAKALKVIMTGHPSFNVEPIVL